MSDDTKKAYKRAARTRRCFVKRCHGGVIELVVPVLSGEQYAGTLFLGPGSDTGSHRGVVHRTEKHLKSMIPMAELFAESLVRIGEALRLHATERTNLSEPIRRGIEFASRSFHEQITVDDAARYANLSPSRFAHRFTDEVGVPYHEYLTKLRIERAEQLLAHTTFKITEIAERTGFCNQNYFAAVFRRYSKQTPSAFRKARQTRISI